MKRIGSILLGLSLALGTTAVFGLPPAQTDQPKAEKKKIDKSKNATSDKNEKGDNQGKGKGKGDSKNQKRKAEEPKAQ